MTNLIDNAIKYSPDRSHVDVRLRSDTENNVIITVEDNGAGIESTQLDAIFTPFLRTDAAKSQEIEGAGLGLALVRELIEINEARIEVHSELKVGSTFKVIIPPLASFSEESRAFLQAGQF